MLTTVGFLKNLSNFEIVSVCNDIRIDMWKIKTPVLNYFVFKNV